MVDAPAHLATRLGTRRRSVPVSERRLLLAGLDAIAVAAAFVIAFNLRTSSVRDSGFYVPRLGTVITLLAWVVCAQTVGAYDLRTARSHRGTLRVVLTSVGATGLVLLAVFFVVPYSITRPTLLLWLPIASLLILLGRLVYLQVLAGSYFAGRIALVVDRDALQRVWPEVQDNLGGLYRVTAVVNPARDDVVDRLRATVRDQGVDQIVLGVRDEVSRDLFRGLLACNDAGVRVRSLADLYEEMTGRLLLDQLGHTWLMALPMRSETSRTYSLFKRLVDVAAGLTGTLVLVLMAPLVWVANHLTGDHGPLFHAQVRVGQYGRTFWLWKLRTMRVRPQGDTAWTERSDHRITRVGRVLRRLHLDELPQAWSILRGDMSVVGPRPEQPQYVEELSGAIDFYRTRLTVRPGLTGWAQVNYGYGSGVDGARVKLSYDLYYIKRQSPVLDLLVLAKTVTAVLSLGGR